MTPARDFSTRPRSRRLSRPQQALLLGGTVAFVLAAWAAGDAWGEHRAAAARLAQVRQETEALRGRIRELQDRRGPEHVIAAQALLTADAAPPRVLAALAELLPGDVRLEGVSLAYAGGHVDLDFRVAAKRPASFDLFLDRLQGSGAFSDVVSGEEERRGDMQTTLRARYRAPGR